MDLFYSMYATICVLAFLASYVTTSEADYCLAEDDQPYLYFSSKTAYHFVHGKNAVHDFQTVKSKYIFYAIIFL